jgi:hypothetical protein
VPPSTNWLVEHGFDFVDLTLKPAAAAPDHSDPGAVRAALDRHGRTVVAYPASPRLFGSPPQPPKGVPGRVPDGAAGSTPRITVPLPHRKPPATEQGHRAPQEATD